MTKLKQRKSMLTNKLLSLGLVLALKDQILCKEFQDEAGEKYNSSFSVFQEWLPDLTMDLKWSKVAKMRVSKLYDAFARNK